MTVTLEVDAILAADPDAELVRNGRYYIVPDGADDLKARPHTRITNFARELEDTFSLVQWQKRMTLLGTALRSDIAVAAVANSDNKQKLNELARSAMDAAEANAARETGSALHRICERVDSGERLELPDPWAGDVAAYQACLEQHHIRILPEHVEQVVVVPDLSLAGRFDRIVEWGGRSYIADLKTGRDLSYSWGSIAVQLALYAGAPTIYYPDTCTHTPMPEVAQDFGIVVHLPAGANRAAAYLVDLESGREGVELIRQVKGWRSRARQFTADLTTLPAGRAAPELRDYALRRVSDLIAAGHGADLAAGWPAGVPTLKASAEHTEAELDLILAAISKVDAAHRLPFPDYDDPRIPRDQSKTQRKAQTIK